MAADGRSGSTVGKYRLHEVVGRGGMGVVYRAEHVYIGREVAVKILHEGYGGREESIKRFLREARAASLINHPNIVEVTDFGKANDGTVFFVMELLVGEPLDNILARDRRLDLLRSITICNQLAAALAAAHSKGIIHRDLKPENVMLIPREGRRELVRRVSDETGGAYELSEREKKFDFVKILDFGVAKVREPDAEKGRITRAGVVFGTPEYMAPETARIGFSDARSDVYALGVMFYEMMTGTVPFTGESAVEVMTKQVNDRVPPMHEIAPDAEVTEEAERMILKALAKDPEGRQQNMEEFHRDLQKCYGQLRFRRTVRTPTGAVPSVTIPLTRKKQPVMVAPPNRGVGGAASPPSPSNDVATERPRPRISTPRMPGLPVRPTAPILLTKRKSAARPVEESAPGAVASWERPTPRGDELTVDEVISYAFPTPPALAAEDTTPPDGTPPEAVGAEKKKKRTTLPLGMDQDDATPVAGTVPPPRLPPFPSRGSEITAAMSLPRRPNVETKTGDGSTSERDTPKVIVAVTAADVAETSWLDEPTVPGAKSGGR